MQEMQGHGFDPWVMEDSLEEGMALHSSIRLENPLDRETWRTAIHSRKESDAN